MKRLAIAASFCFALAGAFWAPAALAQKALAQQEPQAEGCPRLIASRAPRVLPARLARDELGLTFVGHSTFVIESPKGLRAATDFNDYVKPPFLPDVATMNRAHSTHFTHAPDPRIGHVLRGWNPAGGPAAHDLTVQDMRIRNVVTNIRDWQGGTDYDGNSIFVFEAAEICVAHLGHLHHALTPDHIKALGRIDVALVPVDGGYTMSMEQMLDAVQKMGVQIIIPMHFFSQMTLKRFIERAAEIYPVEMSSTPSIVLSRDKLPVRTKVLVLPGR